MKKVSIVIPAFNEENYIGELLNSIAQAHYPRELFEVIVVSDGSTDSTVNVVKKYPGVRVIELSENVGRYKCREKGARAACHPNILFVDSRALVDANILRVLDKVEAKVVCGHVIDPPRPGPFETFFRAVRRMVFRSFYRMSNQPVLLTPENFDRMPKGTTVLFVEKEPLFKAYDLLSQEDMGRYASDDTKLLRTIVDIEPLLIHPDVKIVLNSRKSFTASVNHLMWRGTNFVDYYLHPSKRNFWLVIFLPLVAILALLFGMLLVPLPFIFKVAILVGVDLVVAFILAKSLRDFLIILYILPLCVAIFYAGIVRGILLKRIKALRS